jgi:hypothetical protein
MMVIYCHYFHFLVNGFLDRDALFSRGIERQVLSVFSFFNVNVPGAAWRWCTLGVCLTRCVDGPRAEDIVVLRIYATVDDGDRRDRLCRCSQLLAAQPMFKIALK